MFYYFFYVILHMKYKKGTNQQTEVYKLFIFFIFGLEWMVTSFE